MTDGGLVLPEFGMDEAAIQSALEQIDRDLVLIKPGTLFPSRPEREQFGYRVYRWPSRDREPEFVYMWGDEYGNPYPELSSGLIEEVKRLDKNTRGRQLDEIAREEIRQRDHDKTLADMREGIADNHVRKHGISPPHKGPALQAARRRGRQNGKQTFS